MNKTHLRAGSSQLTECGRSDVLCTRNWEDVTCRTCRRYMDDLLTTYRAKRQIVRALAQWVGLMRDYRPPPVVVIGPGPTVFAVLLRATAAPDDRSPDTRTPH